ncbi:MAG: LiaF domain-containing protein [candidate division WOR-3 bacterium]
MRRWGLFGGMFWGTVLMILGLTLLLNTVLGISIPVFPILFGLLLCYIGIRLLVGWRCSGRLCVHSEHRPTPGEHAGERHDIVFGNGSVDLTGVVLRGDSASAEVNTVFGSGQVLVPSSMPVKVLANVAFGNVRLPNGEGAAFGEYAWKSPGLDETKPHLTVYINVVFGSVRLVAR